MKPILLVLLLSAGCARGWGVLGHEAMARVANGWLSNDVAARVTRILGTNDMASVALWADHLRDAQRNRGPLRTDPEAREFNRRFPHNQNWHYVNLPLGTVRYTRASRFASTNDIVQALNRCVAVLESRSHEMSKTHALRWLIHLVGDIHQPLHVGCGYYRFDPDGKIRLLRQPAEADGRPHDQGGNLLRYTRTQGLHAYWDVNLVELIDPARDRGRLESILRDAVRTRTWRTSGEMATWPAKWAAAAVAEARGAYHGIQFHSAQFDGRGVVTNIAVTLPANYSVKQTERARKQLSRSAFHLAELLNGLDWE